MRDRITILIEELARMKVDISEGRTISSSAATLVSGFGLQLTMVYQALCSTTDRLTSGQMLSGADMMELHEACECVQLIGKALADVDGSLRDAMEGSARPTRPPKPA